MEAIYSGEKPVAARVGDVVLVPGNMRGIVIDVKETFVKVLAIWTSKDTGETFVLPQRLVLDCPASECLYREKQTLNL